eukprot:3475159-Amphidinium_carterae.1
MTLKKLVFTKLANFKKNALGCPQGLEVGRTHKNWRSHQNVFTKQLVKEHTPAALIPKQGALQWAADCLLEDPSFATEAKRQFHLLKLTM